MTSEATKLSVQFGPGAPHTVPVTDGWFAFTALSSGPVGDVRPKLTAYDAAGKVVKVISS